MKVVSRVSDPAVARLAEGLQANSLPFGESLRVTVEAEWERIKEGEFWQRVMRAPVTPELWRDLMLQVYHYSKHNSMNQAVAAFVPAPEGLLKFVYRHAAEELGHEKMVTHDLRSIAMLDDADLQAAPLPATEALIGYLYYVALRYGPVARLGYSFWAEGAHAHIQEPLRKICADLKLTSKNVTFFGAHAEADEAHIQQVEEAIDKYAVTAQDQEMVRRVCTTTLSLTGQLLEQVARQNRTGAAQ
ncbi:iron-containing redox enzyme family protein [Caenimonas aquaedulcis]|uniref:Iron-containing redox enzyme family protein n=1 Tax=Caenimonas aquaedulcis TaxID=2793270 RepID=A0A931H6U6_9BURK|nr:iron-containing redox enzyme family protein [Caenimonas aquaedulcis]MBG9389744.1 iron-containing redox enzyme family protein [Caenimonas aquaedulcis]